MPEFNIERNIGGSPGVSNKVARMELAAGPLVMDAGEVSEVVVM